MSNKTILLFVLLFATLVAGMFMVSYIQKQKTASPTVPPVATSTVPAYGISRIEGKHFFSNGVHTIVGEISLPTPCDLLAVDSTVAESFPEQVTFTFTVVNTTDTCAQVATVQRFKAEATASKEATLSATFMGKPVTLNLVEAAAGETPEEFELFIKG